MVFLCLLCAFLPSRITLEWIDQKFAKTKMGYISLPSNLNGIIGTASFYCVIPKIMTLHDAIKTIKNRVFLFSLKKEQNLVSFQKTPKKTFFFEKKQNNRWVVFFEKKRVFFNPDIGAHRIKHGHNIYFIPFVSSELGMCDRLNSLVCNDRLNSLLFFFFKL